MWIFLIFKVFTQENFFVGVASWNENRVETKQVVFWQDTGLCIGGEIKIG
jgi:hypothetical protein